MYKQIAIQDLYTEVTATFLEIQVYYYGLGIFVVGGGFFFLKHR